MTGDDQNEASDRKADVELLFDYAQGFSAARRLEFGGFEARGNLGRFDHAREAFELCSPDFELFMIGRETHQGTRVTFGDFGAAHQRASSRSLVTKPSSRRS